MFSSASWAKSPVSPRIDLVAVAGLFAPQNADGHTGIDQQASHATGHLLPDFIIGPDTAHIEKIFLVGIRFQSGPLGPFPPFLLRQLIGVAVHGNGLEIIPDPGGFCPSLTSSALAS